jgi:hypothetical protein
MSGGSRFPPLSYPVGEGPQSGPAGLGRALPARWKAGRSGEEAVDTGCFVSRRQPPPDGERRRVPGA